jgi:hypothetical protein
VGTSAPETFPRHIPPEDHGARNGVSLSSSDQIARRELVLLSEGVVTSVRELPQVEYDVYKRAYYFLLQFWGDLQLFDIVRLNHLEFERLVSRYVHDYAAHPVVSSHHMKIMAREANRRILNYLCSVRTFLDHSGANLKARHGEDSEQVKRFDEARHHAYATVFSYRFIYKLRNYVQHCDMPLGSFSLSSTVDRATSKVTHTIELYFDRDTLLKYDSWGLQLEAEIRNLPKEIDIIPHLRAMTGCIDIINQIIVRDELDEARRASQVMNDLANEASRSGKGTPYIAFVRKSALEPSGIEMNIEEIPLHTLNIGGFLVSSP